MDDPRPAATLHALPIPRTRLIGREAEQNDARRRLLDEASALVSLVGTGGVGKTHLALVIARHVAGHFADGVVWLDLSSINDDARVPPAVAQALGLQADTSDAAHESIRALRGRQLLLILDNCEQVIDGAASLAAALLASCPALQILATSRTPLRLRGEQVLQVNPFPLPGSGAADLAALGENSALQLFLERGRAVRPS